MSLGNKADVSSNDLLQYWEDDPETRVILLYLESFGNPRRFARLARRVGRKKPIVVVKAGRSAAGSKAAGSHTAALAASETGVAALFEQAGILRAETLEEMFDPLELTGVPAFTCRPKRCRRHQRGRPRYFGGGRARRGGVCRYPELAAATRERLAAFLPSAASLGNPVDMIASATPEQFKETLEAVLTDEGIDATVVIFTPVGLAATQDVARSVRDAVRSARAEGVGKPVLACLMDAQTLTSELKWEGERLPTYRFPEDAARALAKAYAYARWRATPAGQQFTFDDIDTDKAREVLSQVQARGGGWLAADEIDTVLAAYGLTVAKGKLTRSPAEAVAYAQTCDGPVALKLASRTLVHKSEWEGVQLNLKTPEDIRAACDTIDERLRQADKLSERDGYYVQPMVEGGVELMVGMTHDPLFGPLIAFGLGGIYVEVLRDVVFRITPLTDLDAKAMITGIKGYKLLEGYRGSPPADTDAVETLLLRLSRLVEDLPEISELDLNPVKALGPGEGCVILDARLRCAQPSDETGP